MRVTGGQYNGRTIKCPKGIIRPAMDRMRESMFSILGSMDGLSFLDIFSGSGSVGIEAASRGAYPVHLVEKDHIKKKTIEENISWVDSEIRLFLMPAEKYLRRFTNEYDFVHLDPPFPFKQKLEVLELAESSGVVKIGGTLTLHYPGEESFPDKLGSFRRYDLREYGRSKLIFYTRD
ncbi:16S rRNA (guanine(966)-N(2))-methyltransferase RsmD [Oceanispirochaeta crateris]|uniref:16S rRNA (Guanine(966)-N(2))-methyltransferase RsmD n=1 Tax=Oceanispirochaeta crateris TaxID=2518645 RepID=A0A5C1QLV7_9SPIO|nr:16S rRNA (guanine(966)-N(2))-methyltransferase RsmD [Oceanispirochaeta crateris]QEN07960.1 16S rRNA (guanine(966)-N(2))-methyltransferase RsmD [Oceanispirochaeta crateris]